MCRAKQDLNPSVARKPPAGTRFKAGRRPAVEASDYNNPNRQIYNVTDDNTP